MILYEVKNNLTGIITIMSDEQIETAYPEIQSGELTIISTIDEDI
ncbi:MAG: hypothetical protein ACMV1B_04770 [Prevotella sp.]